MNAAAHDIKKQLRKKLRHVRREISETDRDQCSILMTQHFISSSYFTESQQIAFYVTHDGEIDPTHLLKRAWQLGKCCYLPVMTGKRSKQLYFVRYEAGESLDSNEYGILEPSLISSKHPIDPTALDLVLLPLVGFDLKGARLGMGAGCYDYTFAFRKTSQKPLLIGLGYECQHCDLFPIESWDIPLDGVVTEKEFYMFK